MAQAYAQDTVLPTPSANATVATEPSITPPDGYLESDVVLANEIVEGANVYDTSGQEIGKVQGLVYLYGDSAVKDNPSLSALSESQAEKSKSTPPAETPIGDARTITDTQISHVIIEVGSFLGLSDHQVAVPISDLVTYRKDTDLRVYLPWTKAQLNALPKLSEDGPSPIK